MVTLVKQSNDNSAVEEVQMEFSEFWKRINNKRTKTDELVIYGKDLHCPNQWEGLLMDKILPSTVSYKRQNDLSKNILLFLLFFAEYPSNQFCFFFFRLQ